MKHRLTLLTAALLLACMPPASAQKVSDLTAITGANVDAAADLLLISDISAGTSKKMTLAQLVNVPALFGSVSATELGYLDGVTSAIQTQLNLKAPLISPSFTTPALGTPTSGNFSSGTFTWPTFNQSTTGNAATATLASTVTTNANLTGVVTSVGNATAIADSALSIAKTSGLQAVANAATTGPLRVACVGTSITDTGSTLTTTHTPRLMDSTQGHHGWLEHLSNHRVRLVRKNGVFEGGSSNGMSKAFGYQGIGLTVLTNGSVSTGGVYPLDNAIASGPEVLVLEGGTNDVTGTSAETVITRITAYWTKAAASGLKVIALNILPGGTPTINSTTRDTIATVNAALPALATSLGITLIDTHAAGVATMSGGYATTETLFDGVHPTPAYAHRIAVLINAQLAPLYTKRPQTVIVPNSASGLWLTPNNSPSGAVQPASWTKIGTHTNTWTAITDADGTTWQRLRMEQGGTPLSVNQFFTQATGVAGDRVRFACRIRAVDGATFSANEIEFAGQYAASGTFNVIAISGGSNLGIGDYDPITGLFISPEITFPTGVTDIYAKLVVYNTDVTLDIRQFGIFKVISNP